ncbi:MAG TPA: HAD family phosphatase [Phycisphaerae bacterium]|mgnify:CR=1 FL=1|nr:HAD family phosphatase [Phycisphaerae bacterium]
MKAILFDFDGVIVDSEPLHFESFCAVLKPYGINLDRDYYNNHYLGYNDWEVLEKIRQENHGADFHGDDPATIISRKTALMQNTFRTQPPILPGVVELLRLAKLENIKLAVFSGALKQEIYTALNFLGIFSMFDSIMAAEDVAMGKPNPMGYLLSAERLGVAPKQCVVIEDSPIGLTAAKAAGMKTCALSTTYQPQTLSAANIVVPNLSCVTIENLKSLFM